MHVVIEPVHKEVGDISAVLFRHHLVAISAQADFFQSHVGRFYTRLIKPLRSATGEWAMIAGLARHLEDGETFHVEVFYEQGE